MIQRPPPVARPAAAMIPPRAFGRAVRVPIPVSRLREDARFFLFAYLGALLVFLTWLA